MDAVGRGGLSDPRLDVVLITHPRDEGDVPRLFPWAQGLSAEEIRRVAHGMRADYAEISQADQISVGVIFVPLFAADILAGSPGAALEVLVEQGLGAAARCGARYASLGGLTGALSMYGELICERARAQGVRLGTGHCATAVSVVRTLKAAAAGLDRPLQDGRLVMLGLGSVGAGALRLLLRSRRRPARITLIDRPARRKRLEQLCAEIVAAGCGADIELTDRDGGLSPDSWAYRANFVVSAISSAHVLDLARVRPATILIDDSQPHAWSREAAWARCAARGDIAPCEAGLVDCSALGYVSNLPFDFAGDAGRPDGAGTAWSCLAEAMLCALDPTLEPTIGEPTVPNLLRFNEAFDRFGLTVAPLQCAPHLLPVTALRHQFADLAARV